MLLGSPATAKSATPFLLLTAARRPGLIGETRVSHETRLQLVSAAERRVRRPSRVSVGAAGSLGAHLDAPLATARPVGRRCIASTKAVFAAKRMSL